MTVYTILADREYNPRANFRRAARCSGYIRQRNSLIAATSSVAACSASPRQPGDAEPSPGIGPTPTFWSTTRTSRSVELSQPRVGGVALDAGEFGLRLSACRQTE
jgi:hypothetical protein